MWSMFVIPLYIKYKVNTKLPRQTYYAFMYFKMNYGIEIYGSCSSTNIEKIEIMQNKLMKSLLRLRRMIPWVAYEFEYIDDIYKSNLLSFMNEMLSGRSPELFKNYFVLKNNQYDMRRIGQLNVPSCRAQICDIAVRAFGASLWNRLETCMVQYSFKEMF